MAFVLPAMVMLCICRWLLQSKDSGHNSAGWTYMKNKLLVSPPTPFCLGLTWFGLDWPLKGTADAL